MIKRVAGCTALIAAIFCTCPAAQSVFDNGFEDPVNVRVSISGPTEVTSREGARLVATVSADNGSVSQDVSWSSSRPDIFRVVNGRISPISLASRGTSMITATSVDYPSAQATYEVTLRDAYLIHQYVLNETGFPPLTLRDSLGNADASLVSLDGSNDGSNAGGGVVTLEGGPWATADYIALPDNILQGLEDVSIEIWASPLSVQNWSRIFDFGSDFTNYLMMSWTQGTDLNADRMEWRNGNNFATRDNAMAPYTLPQQTHIVLTINGGTTSNQISLYRDGIFRTSFFTDLSLDQLATGANSLGRSKYSFDNTANARYDELNIYRGTLLDSRIAENFANGPFGGQAEPQTTVEVTGPSEITLGQETFLDASVISTGGPISQQVVWSSSNPEVVFAGPFGQIGGFQLGTATITARSVVGNQPLDQRIVTVTPPAWTVGKRLTATDVIGDINALQRQPVSEAWGGMRYPSNLADRGPGGHIQGVTRVGNTWVLSHSRDDSRGLLIFGNDIAGWTFAPGNPKPGLGNHPGGLQSVDDVVVVTHKFGSNGNGIKFFQFGPQHEGGYAELTHLRIVNEDSELPNIGGNPLGGRGEAAGFAYHPVHGRFYLIDGANTGADPSGGHDLYRTTKIGGQLTDPQNGWEYMGAARDYLLVSDLFEAGRNAIYGAQGGMNLIYSERDQAMYVVALSRPEGGDILLQNSHRIDVTRLDFDLREADYQFSRSDFTRTDNLLLDPTFRFGAGMLLGFDGSIEFVATERCTSYETTVFSPFNAFPCLAQQVLVKYFFLRR